jgi:hypothetical protein
MQDDKQWVADDAISRSGKNGWKVRGLKEKLRPSSWTHCILPLTLCFCHPKGWYTVWIENPPSKHFASFDESESQENQGLSIIVRLSDCPSFFPRLSFGLLCSRMQLTRLWWRKEGGPMSEVRRPTISLQISELIFPNLHLKPCNSTLLKLLLWWPSKIHPGKKQPWYKAQIFASIVTLQQGVLWKM